MRLVFPSDDKRRSRYDEELSMLLKVKRAEVPSSDFWAEFETKLHRRLLEPAVDSKTWVDEFCLFFMASKRTLSFISGVACFAAILMALSSKHPHETYCSSPMSSTQAKQFVRNELSSENICHDTVSYSLASDGCVAMCYVSNSVDGDSCWTGHNNSF
jgi:hypothetical protein